MILRSPRLPDVDVSGEAGQMPEYEVIKAQEGKLPKVDVDVRGGVLLKVSFVFVNWGHVTRRGPSTLELKFTDNACQVKHGSWHLGLQHLQTGCTAGPTLRCKWTI